MKDKTWCHCCIVIVDDFLRTEKFDGCIFIFKERFRHFACWFSECRCCRYMEWWVPSPLLLWKPWRHRLAWLQKDSHGQSVLISPSLVSDDAFASLLTVCPVFVCTTTRLSSAARVYMCFDSVGIFVWSLCCSMSALQECHERAGVSWCIGYGVYEGRLPVGLQYWVSMLSWFMVACICILCFVFVPVGYTCSYDCCRNTLRFQLVMTKLSSVRAAFPQPPGDVQTVLESSHCCWIACSLCLISWMSGRFEEAFKSRMTWVAKSFSCRKDSIYRLASPSLWHWHSNV